MTLKAPFLREITLKDGEHNIQEFPFTIPSLQGGKLHVPFPSPVTFFVGENGSGKSTVLEAIAVGCGFSPAGGSRNNVYDYIPTESSLASQIRLVWNFKMMHGFFLRAESFFNFASHIDDLKENGGQGEAAYRPYGGKSLHTQSHGESFMTLFENRFNRGIYLLDEPEAALSPVRQLKFLALLDALVEKGETQFIIATHSPILLSYPAATIYKFDEQGINSVQYTDTEHFTVTKDFLNAHEGFYKHLREPKTLDAGLGTLDFILKDSSV